MPGTDTAQRWAFGELNALDLRAVNDSDVGTPLRDAYPGAHTAVVDGAIHAAT